MLFHRGLSLTLRLKVTASILLLIFSILLVWRRSDLFNVNLQITGYFSLHNQTPLHITLSDLVFTSHFICFYYIMICPVSPAYTIGVASFACSRCILVVDFEQIIVSVILFTVLFANQIIQQYMHHWCYLVCLTPAHWLLL